MSDSDSDEDLKRAIALSLQQSSPDSITESSTVIDLVSSDDEDDLSPQVTDAKVTSVSSRNGSQGKPDQNVAKSGNLNTATSTLNTNLQKPVVLSGFGLLGLDRKAMEAERRARAAQKQKNQVEKTEVESRKRKASLSLPESSASLSEAKKVRSSQIKDNTQSPQSSLSIRPSTIANTLIQYPKGVVKRTWAKGFPRQADDIKIEEVFQKDTLNYAVLSAFQIDPAWVQTKLEPRTKVVWVLQAKNDAEKQHWMSGADNDYRFCFPSMEGNINCMHSKLQILVYSSHLRIVVPSGNLTSYDWGETGVVENVCFLIDLPRLPSGQEANCDQTQFGREFLRFVDEMGLEQNLVKGLRKFDFAQTGHLGFVHSIGGSHIGGALQRTGYCGLASCIRELGLHTNKTLELDFLSGSIGSISYPFINSMVLAAQGIDELAENGLSIDKCSKPRGVYQADDQLPNSLQNRCRIYFPTRQTVVNCRGGVNESGSAGGTICLEPKLYNAASFPRPLMRDCQSTRNGLLIHSKIWFVRPKKTDLESRPAWAYVGSANLSESAWGRLVKDRATKKHKLNCRNWECGVVFPTPAKHNGELQDSVGMEVFEGHVPVPMITPGKPYDGARPWFYKEQ